MYYGNNKIIHEDIETIVGRPLDWSVLEGKTILVTGSGGFLGTYIVYTLLWLNDFLFKDKTTVLAVVRSVEKARSRFANLSGREDLCFLQSDISIPFDIEIPIDYIIHAASQASSFHFSHDPVGTLKANTLGTSYLLDLAVRKNVKKFLFFSSGEVYGNLDKCSEAVNELYHGDVDFLDVRSCYAESKRMGENMCVCWSYQYKVPVNVIRVGYTYGPGIPLSDDRVFADFVSSIIKNENIKLKSDGTARRSFCYITDMIEAVFLVLIKGKEGEVYNAASNKQTSILELATLLAGLWPEKKLKVEFTENSSEHGYLRSKRARTLVCVDKIKAIGWVPKVDLELGFRRMVESYLS